MNNEVKNGIIITITVILVLVVVYLVTAVFMTGEIGSSKSDDEENSTSSLNDTSSSSYDNMIIAGRVFEQKEDKYMVIFFSEKDDSDALKTTITSYDQAGSDVKLYKVNTDEVINSYVLGDDFNSVATSDSEIRINDVTVITIENKVITSYVIGAENVINELK